MSTIAARKNIDWLMTRFVEQTGVAHAIVVSADGLTLATSPDLPADRAEQLAAITAGTVSLTFGVARYFDGGSVVQTVVEMDGGYLFLMSVADGSFLAVLAARGCDVGQVGYEMTLLVEQVGWAMSAAPRSSAVTADMREVPQAS